MQLFYLFCFGAQVRGNSGVAREGDPPQVSPFYDKLKNMFNIIGNVIIVNWTKNDLKHLLTYLFSGGRKVTKNLTHKSVEALKNFPN